MVKQNLLINIQIPALQFLVILYIGISFIKDIHDLTNIFFDGLPKFKTIISVVVVWNIYYISILDVVRKIKLFINLKIGKTFP